MSSATAEDTRAQSTEAVSQRAKHARAEAQRAADRAEQDVGTFARRLRETRGNLNNALRRLLPYDVTGELKRALTDAMPALIAGKLPKDEERRLLQLAADAHIGRVLLTHAALLPDSLFTDIDSADGEVRFGAATARLEEAKLAAGEARSAAHEIEHMHRAVAEAKTMARLDPTRAILGTLNPRSLQREMDAGVSALEADAAARAAPLLELAEAAAARATAAGQCVRAALEGQS